MRCCGTSGKKQMPRCGWRCANRMNPLDDSTKNMASTSQEGVADTTEIQWRMQCSMTFALPDSPRADRCSVMITRMIVIIRDVRTERTEMAQGHLPIVEKFYENSLNVFLGCATF